jgi:hypothetical protein
MPAFHYLTSLPNAELLKHSRRPKEILLLNNELAANQPSCNQNKSSKAVFTTNLVEIAQLSNSLQELYKSLPNYMFETITINGFPFHELCLRDLSLTYKYSPREVMTPDSPGYLIFLDAVRLNLLLLMRLLSEPEVGNYCFYMSFYTASCVFKFFCDQIGVNSIYFDRPFIDPGVLELEASSHIRLLHNISQRIYSTQPNIYNSLKLLNPPNGLASRLVKYIDTRFSGQGSHIYSNGLDAASQTTLILKEKLLTCNGKGGKIVAMFTSSDDEDIGIQLNYSHEKVATDHLSIPPFANQEEWIYKTIEYFCNKRKNDLLIVRFHPRLAADKRGLPSARSFTSTWEALEQKYSDVQNILLIHPSDPISSYKVGLDADLILNGWSTIGLEFAIKGKLVNNAFCRCIQGAGAIHPVQESAPLLHTSEEYMKRIAQLLSVESQGTNNLPVVSQQEALIAILLYSYSGIVDISKPELLKSQIFSPALLTPTLLKLFNSTNQ